MKEQSNSNLPLQELTREDDIYITINIYRRPMHEFIGWIVWLFTAIFFLQNAVASSYENERRAALLYWAIFIVMGIFGFVTFVIRRIRIAELLEERHEIHNNIIDKDL